MPPSHEGLQTITAKLHQISGSNVLRLLPAPAHDLEITSSQGEGSGGEDGSRRRTSLFCIFL